MYTEDDDRDLKLLYNISRTRKIQYRRRICRTAIWIDVVDYYYWYLHVNGLPQRTDTECICVFFIPCAAGRGGKGRVKKKKTKEKNQHGNLDYY